MTAYSNFIQDFPARCRDILNSYEQDATQRDREVSLLIMVATSAFIIPYERLNSSDKEHIADDRDSKAIKELNKFLGGNFTSWQTGNTWSMIEELDGQVIRTSGLDALLQPDKRHPIPSDKPVSFILAIIRNALAHGNIFIHSATNRGQNTPKMQDIILLSKVRDKETGELTDEYRAVYVSLSDFRTLVLEWISFLEQIKLS